MSDTYYYRPGHNNGYVNGNKFESHLTQFGYDRWSRPEGIVVEAPEAVPYGSKRRGNGNSDGMVFHQGSYRNEFHGGDGDIASDRAGASGGKMKKKKHK